MVYKAIIFVWLVILFTVVAQAYAYDDECGSDVDLNLFSVEFSFTGHNHGIRLDWELRTPTDCPLQYRLTVHDEELGIIAITNGGDYFNLTIPLENLVDRNRVPVQITSLQPNSMYYFRVSVENSGGLSHATALAVQTLNFSEA